MSSCWAAGHNREPNEREQTMRKILFLMSHLSESDLDWIAVSGETRRIKAGTAIIKKGKPIDALYIVLDGTAEVLDADIDGKPIQVGCGELLGEVSMLDPRPPMATVVAESDAILLALPLELLNEKLQDDESFASRFYHSLALLLAHRLRKSVQRLVFGNGDGPFSEGEEYEDELNPELLDTMHLMGNRFTRFLQRTLPE